MCKLSVWLITFGSSTPLTKGRMFFIWLATNQQTPNKARTVVFSLQAKNAALAAAGAIVPDSFEGLEGAVRDTFNR